MKKLIIILVSLFLFFSAVAVFAEEEQEREWKNPEISILVGAGQTFGSFMGAGYEMGWKRLRYCVGIGFNHESEFGGAIMAKFYPIIDRKTSIYLGVGFGTHPLGTLISDDEAGFGLADLVYELHDILLLEINAGCWSSDLDFTGSLLFIIKPFN